MRSEDTETDPTLLLLNVTFLKAKDLSLKYNFPKVNFQRSGQNSI